MAPLIEERIEILERRLLQQESINEIRGVLGSYCKAIDARNPDALSPLLCEEISLVVTPWEIDIKGRAAVMNFFHDYFLSEWEAPRHYCANETIEPRGTGFHSFCYFHETLSRNNESVVGWGTFEDQFALEDGRWKISQRSVTILALTPATRGWAMDDKIMAF